MSPAYILSLIVNSLLKKSFVRGLAKTEEKGTFLAPGTCAWASGSGFGVTLRTLRGWEKRSSYWAS